jgi:hypothetical protein
MGDDATPERHSPESESLPSKQRVWTQEEEQILVDTKDKAQAYRWLHYRTSTYYWKLDLCLSLPNVIINGIATTAAFSSFGENAGTSRSLTVFVGILSLLNTLLAASRQFLNFGVKSTKHKDTSSAFSKLARKIQRELVLPLEERKPFKEFMISVDDEYGRLQSQAESIPESVSRSFQEAVAGLRDGISADMVVNRAVEVQRAMMQAPVGAVQVVVDHGSMRRDSVTGDTSESRHAPTLSSVGGYGGLAGMRGSMGGGNTYLGEEGLSKNDAFYAYTHANKNERESNQDAYARGYAHALRDAPAQERPSGIQKWFGSRRGIVEKSKRRLSHTSVASAKSRNAIFPQVEFTRTTFASESVAPSAAVSPEIPFPTPPDSEGSPRSHPALSTPEGAQNHDQRVRLPPIAWTTKTPSVQNLENITEVVSDRTSPDKSSDKSLDKSSDKSLDNSLDPERKSPERSVDSYIPLNKKIPPLPLTVDPRIAEGLLKLIPREKPKASHAGAARYREPGAARYRDPDAKTPADPPASKSQRRLFLK